jgi:hypothetical protein
LLDRVAGLPYAFGGIWSEDMVVVKKCTQTCHSLMEMYFPAVVQRMSDIGIPTILHSYYTQFFITGFLYNLPFNMAVRVWDSFWLRKFDFFYAVTLAIFKLTKGMNYFRISFLFSVVV